MDNSYSKHSDYIIQSLGVPSHLFFGEITALAEPLFPIAVERVCPCCERLRTDVISRRQNTAYVDDTLNWLDSCLDCWLAADLYWAEMWDEYNRGRM
jgi:hypothetical protein